ncbi:DUF5666 domain-containing protein [Cellulomonas chitinilytica]|nr:DUF5666 domain-containing protein [Cellulomonas chitinilytica]
MTRSPRTRRTAAALALPALATVGVLLLAACSSAGGDGTGTRQDGGGSTAQAPQTTGRQGGGGTSGEIVAIDGTVMQLRGSDSQTSVTWTDTTTVTRTVAAALADVTVGSCVATTSASTGDDAQSSDDAGPASTVRITAASDDGTCGFGGGAFGGPGGGPGGGGGPQGGEQGGGPQGTRPTGRPDGAPTDLPSGAPGFTGGFGGFSSGTVTAVDGSTITIEQTRPQLSPDGGASDDPTTSTVTVTVDASTTYTKEAASDASAIAVGLCAVARGEADDSGKVTATTLTLSDKSADGCSTGFMMRGTRPGGGTGDDQDGGSNA